MKSDFTAKLYLPVPCDVFRYVLAGNGEMYMVVIDGHLHVVSRMKEDFLDDDGYSDYRTYDFFVYKLDVENKLWEKVECLMDVSFFVGNNTSMFADISNAQRNAIYFTDDEKDFWRHGRVRLRGHDMGVYDMTSLCFKKFYQGLISMTVNLSVMAFLRRLNTNDSRHSADLAFSNYKQFGVVTLGLLTHHLFCHLFEFPEPEGQGILNSKGYSVVETLNMSRTALWDREVHLMLAYLFGLHFLSNDLCEADPKAFIAKWTMLLPTNDVLQPRKYEATLMTCLLFDPFLKTRVASASAIAAMLEEPSSVALQVAEYRDSTKCGSYMALSSSMGQILMQLTQVYTRSELFMLRICFLLILCAILDSTREAYWTIDFLVQDSHAVDIIHTVNIFVLCYSVLHQSRARYFLISFCCMFLAKFENLELHLDVFLWYSRMPGELLPRVLSSPRFRIEEGFSFKNDQTSLLAISISCLTGAVATSPSSSHVNEMFEAEISAGRENLGILEHFSSKQLAVTSWERSSVILKDLMDGTVSNLALAFPPLSPFLSGYILFVRKQQQQFILSSCIKAANDSVPSVRAAACRAIGFIACFPEIFKRNSYEFINAVEVNTHDQPVSVSSIGFILNSNYLCVSLHLGLWQTYATHFDTVFLKFPLVDSEANFRLLTLLECSLKLTTVGDKVVYRLASRCRLNPVTSACADPKALYKIMLAKAMYPLKKGICVI
uniref:DUF295 domain-containing protein n=1 Tax=Chenopodium quinoa TaxID=63459 RepID=A0A803LBC3_CHEQI